MAVIGPNDYARELGKKGTISDITLYDMKQGTDTVTLIEPTKYPDRLAPLFYAVSMADRAVLVVDAINAVLGECIVMLHCAGVAEGYLILRNFLTMDQMAPLIKGTVVENYRLVEDDRTMLRGLLMAEAEGLAPKVDEGKGAVPIDHFFNVKGVGTVILGHVARGTIHKHEVLKVLPSDRTAIVRSIQKHDDDYDEAGEGDRVGLALKGIDVEVLDRGYVLTADPNVRCDQEVTAPARLVDYWKMPIKEGMVLHLGHWMQVISARVTAVSGELRQPTLSLTMDKPLVHPPGARVVLMYLEGGKLRVMGTMDIQ